MEIIHESSWSLAKPLRGARLDHIVTSLDGVTIEVWFSSSEGHLVRVLSKHQDDEFYDEVLYVE